MRSQRTLILSLFSPALLLSACGGTKTVSGQAWVRNACTATKTWVQDVQNQVQDLTTAVTDSPAKGKQLISNLIETMIKSTETLITDVNGSGVPDVEDGEHVATTFVNAFSQAKTNLENLRDDVANLNTSDPQAFASGAAALSTKLDHAFDQSGSALDKLSSPELERIGNNTPECQSIGQ